MTITNCTDFANIKFIKIAYTRVNGLKQNYKNNQFFYKIWVLSKKGVI